MKGMSALLIEALVGSDLTLLPAVSRCCLVIVSLNALHLKETSCSLTSIWIQHLGIQEKPTRSSKKEYTSRHVRVMSCALCRV